MEDQAGSDDREVWKRHAITALEAVIAGVPDPTGGRYQPAGTPTL